MISNTQASVEINTGELWLRYRVSGRGSAARFCIDLGTKTFGEEPNVLFTSNDSVPTRWVTSLFPRKEAEQLFRDNPSLPAFIKEAELNIGRFGGAISQFFITFSPALVH